MKMLRSIPAAFAATLIFAAAAPRAGAEATPATTTGSLDSLARAFLQAAEAYQAAMGPDAAARRTGYAGSVAAFDSLVDSALILARSVTRKALPLSAKLARLAERRGATDSIDVANLQAEVYDEAMRLKQPIGGVLLRGADLSAESDSQFVCCPRIPYDSSATAPLRALAAHARPIHAALMNRIDRGRIAEEIRADEAIIRKFSLKLLEGFPAYPWEYLVNLKGDRRNPASGQIIWLHPTFGFTYEGGWDSAPVNALMLEGFRPSIQLEVAGFNWYFFNRRFNYLGASAVVWTGATRNEGGIGFNAHLANWVTLGVSLSTARNISFPLFHPGRWEADWDGEPRLMLGWTTATEKALRIFRKD